MVIAPTCVLTESQVAQTDLGEASAPRTAGRSRRAGQALGEPSQTILRGAIRAIRQIPYLCV